MPIINSLLNCMCMRQQLAWEPYCIRHEGEDHVIAYARRSLHNSERRYPAHKLEFLALKWAITEKFHDYLYGGNFDVYTDNDPFAYVLTTAKLDDTGLRWSASLSNYKFRIFYKTGRR